MSGRRRRVLIVEDNADARESLRLLLELAGHEVETAEDAASGLEKLAALRPDVALIDIGLPGHRRLRARAAAPRAARGARDCGSSRSRATARRRTGGSALDAGFDVHLTKPVDPDRLQRLLAG